MGSQQHRQVRVSRYLKGSIAASIAVFLYVVQPAIADVLGAILGTVTDQSAAVVPRAHVLLLNANTGLRREAVTDANGSYEFLGVPVGEGYSLEVQSPPFRKSEQSSIKILVNQRYRADFKLEVGSLQGTTPACKPNRSR